MDYQNAASGRLDNGISISVVNWQENAVIENFLHSLAQVPETKKSKKSHAPADSSGLPEINGDDDGVLEDNNAEMVADCPAIITSLPVHGGNDSTFTPFEGA